MHECCTSERFEFVLEVKLLSSEPREINAEIRAYGVLLECPAHLVDPLHHCVWRGPCQTEKQRQ